MLPKGRTILWTVKNWFAQDIFESLWSEINWNCYWVGCFVGLNRYCVQVSIYSPVNCYGLSVAREQQLNQDLKRIYKWDYEFSNSSLLPECIAFKLWFDFHNFCFCFKCSAWKFLNLDQQLWHLILNLVCHFFAVSPPWSNS